MFNVLKNLSCAMLSLTVLMPIIASASPTETVIYRFKGGADGSSPKGALLMGGGGALYGGTGNAGASTVFRMVPPASGNGAWVKHVIYDFENLGIFGSGPAAGVIMDKHGVLYGTIASGSGPGGVYKVSPPKSSGTSSWSGSRLYAFSQTSGYASVAPLVLDAAGAVYGTTQSGGTGKIGGVFKLTAPTSGKGDWTQETVYDFGSTGTYDDGKPHGGVIFGADGALYGTAYDGGLGGVQVAGAVFKLTPPVGGGTGPWTEKVLYTFTGGADGGNPTGELVMDRQGGLYGTTSYGGLGNVSKKAQQHGVVYKLTAPAVANGVWHEKVLYKFKGGTDGTNPAAGLLRSASGVLYGTTVKGGTAGLGTVFALTPPKAGATAWTHTVLHSFIGGSDGASPEGALIADDTGAIYGTTSSGGGTGSNCASSGCGTVYKILP